MKEKISRNKISRHYKSFFELDNMALGENDNLMIDWGESLINELINQEVEKRIAERMLTDEDIIDFALLYVSHKSLKPANKGLIKDAIIIGMKQLRSRLTPQDTPQVTHQVPYKTEGGE